MKISKQIAANSKALKAVSDSARLTVLQALLKKNVYVGEFIKSLKIEPTLLSHHLSILRSEGLVESKREGKRVLYKLNPKVKIRGKNPGLNLGLCKLTFTK